MRGGGSGFRAFLAELLGAHVNGLGPDDLVFTTPQGDVLRASNFRRDVFTPAAHQVGLDGLVPHALRHTAASLAIAAGADVKVVQQMLGHTSATMTLDLYGHLFDDRLDEIASALDSAAPTAAQDHADYLRTGGQLITLESIKQTATGQPIQGLYRVPPVGFEPTTPGLGVRRSIP